jgi:hypothetical protein
MMLKVLSKTTDPNVPLQEQEYFELRLDDLGFLFRPHLLNGLGVFARRRFVVREAHAAWSEIDRDLMWRDMTLTNARPLRKPISATSFEEP